MHTPLFVKNFEIQFDNFLIWLIAKNIYYLGALLQKSR
jgi:hypothetical protein